ncbi:MAG TPA: hypothetical protein VF137_12430 [Candidatus Dormibacteraeota bacterium]
MRRSRSDSGRTRAVARERPVGLDGVDGVGHPHLAPPGWEIGRPVSELASEAPLSTAQAVAVTLAVLSALGELHSQGQTHGHVSPSAVGVGTDGWVRLSVDAAESGERGAQGDVQDVGKLLCELMQVEVEPNPVLPGAPAEKAAPALVALGRKVASEPPAWSVDEVWVAIRDAAGFWGAEPQLVDALGELADRVAGTGPIERAVTRVIPGPPLRAEAPPTAPEPGGDRHALTLPRISLTKAVLPALPSPSQVPLPKIASPRSVLASRFAKVAGAAVTGGILLGALAGALATHSGSARASAARRPIPKHVSVPAPAKPASLYASSPDAAVSMFFQLVQQQKLDQAALLWKPKMAAAVDLQSRFGGITSIDLRRNSVAAENDQLGIATVAVDWLETDADGSTHEFSGVIYTDSGPLLWRWDSWRVNEVTAPSNGDGGDGG